MSIWRDRNLLIVFGVTLMAVLGVASIAPVLPRLAAVFAITPQRAGLLILAFTTPGVLLTPVVGVLADRFGRRRVIVPSLWLFAVAGCACAAAQTFTQLLILRWLQGMGAAALGALNLVLLGDLYEGRRRAAVMGWNMTALSVGTAAYPGLGGLLAEFGWRWPFLLAAAAVPVALAVQCCLRNPEPSSGQTWRAYFGAVVQYVWRPPVGATFTVSLVIFVLLYGAILTYFPVLLDRRFAFSPAIIGMYLTGSSVMTGLWSAAAGRLAARLPERRLILIAFLLVAPALVLLAILPTAGALILPIAMFGTAMGLGMPSLMTVLAGLAPAEYRGAFLSLNGMILRLGQTLGPLLGGLLYGGQGLAAVFLGGALLAAVTLLVVVPFVPRRARDRATSRCAILIAASLASVVVAGPTAAATTAPATPAVARAAAANALVVSQNVLASRVGAEALLAGGNAVDAAVATAFALAVTHPTAGNIGGGGFLLYRPDAGDPVAYDFRETAPAGAHPEMWLTGGVYDPQRHHLSHLSVGVPGTVAGLHLAWRDHGALPWCRLVEPAIALARDGFVVTEGLAASLQRARPRLEPYAASLAQFTRDGEPFTAGDLLVQADLAATLERIAAQGPDGFYQGRTAELIVREMERGGGLITHADLAGYQAMRRAPVRGSYRGHEVLSMPPPSSGGVALVTMLNILEGYDLAALGPGQPATLHLMAEAMRRAYADRALHLGDPDSNPDLPLGRLASKAHADALRAKIDPHRAAVSRPERFAWETVAESPETTHLSIVDGRRNAVALTYTLEMGYGSGIVVPGAGFLLNNEMGDFNAAPGLTDTLGRIGTAPNLAEPGKRMLSSMTPAIVVRDGRLVMVTGSLGGRTIINTVLQTILNVLDHGLDAQAAVDAGRIHHQWLPDRIQYEQGRFAAETLVDLRRRGHELLEVESQGVAAVIVVDLDSGALTAGVDARAPDGGAAGY